ncbi:hypothetical protein ZOSMA_211G00100 [Zostera marina]|uniref:Uncharacterized protein n=1 Tax=Zostera marina TaxID=29655 RepID=A0A0K9PKK7_ZOSMR|nr:hypothetical protein ZOSMA_211G00100 [Zostera marina]
MYCESLFIRKTKCILSTHGDNVFKR